MAAAHHCASLLNKDTFFGDFTTTSILVPATEYAESSGAAAGDWQPLVRTGSRWSTYTETKQVCGQAISVHLLDASGPLSLPGAVLLTGDFNKGAQRGKNKHIAPLVAAFSRASVPCPSHGYRLHVGARRHELSAPTCGWISLFVANRCFFLGVFCFFYVVFVVGHSRFHTSFAW